MLNADKVKSIAREIGFDLVGITGAQPMWELAELLQERQAKGLMPAFVSGNPEERLDPGRLMPGAKSVVMVALNYYNPKHSQQSSAGLSRSTFGLDYHRVMRQMLEELGTRLKRIEPDLRYFIFVDNGPLLERELARQAGLGWIGKHTNLITPSFGSWVFLGGMLLNLELDEDRPLEKSCGSCRECVQACPAGALEEAYQVNPHRCLSYLTQKKGYLTGEERKLLGYRTYGCDTCQEVCPVNQTAARVTAHQAFKNWEHDKLTLGKLATISNQEFRGLLGQSSLAWRGKTNLKRNAVIALGNSRNEEAIPILQEAIKDPSPVVRGHAVWALSRFNHPAVKTILQNALQVETDLQVKRELQSALK